MAVPHPHRHRRPRRRRLLYSQEHRRQKPRRPLCQARDEGVRRARTWNAQLAGGSASTTTRNQPEPGAGPRAWRVRGYHGDVAPPSRSSRLRPRRSAHTRRRVSRAPEVRRRPTELGATCLRAGEVENCLLMPKRRMVSSSRFFLGGGHAKQEGAKKAGAIFLKLPRSEPRRPRGALAAEPRVHAARPLSRRRCRRNTC